MQARKPCEKFGALLQRSAHRSEHLLYGHDAILSNGKRIWTTSSLQALEYHRSFSALYVASMPASRSRSSTPPNRLLVPKLSGVYRRWVTLWQAGIALLIVANANADMIAIVEQLSESTTLAQASSTAGANATVNQYISEQVAHLMQAGLQLGWTVAPSSPVEWASKICGLALTFAAVMLGAPFWFDLLKQIVPVRTEGLKPPDSGGPLRNAQRGASVST